MSNPANLLWWERKTNIIIINWSVHIKCPESWPLASCMCRDLAARNCLVSGDGTVVVGDYGISQQHYQVVYLILLTLLLLRLHYRISVNFTSLIYNYNSNNNIIIFLYLLLNYHHYYCNYCHERTRWWRCEWSNVAGWCWGEEVGRVFWAGTDCGICRTSQ